MRGTYDNSHNRNRTRIDARDQSDPYVQAGVRNIHRNTRGQVIGGTTAEGHKLKAGGFRVPPQGGGSQTGSNPNYVPAARGNRLGDRQNLYKAMKQAGSGALTPEMRSKAKSLGITDQAFNAAAGRIFDNEQVTPPPKKKKGYTTPPPPAARKTRPAPVSKINGQPANAYLASERKRLGMDRHVTKKKKKAWRSPSPVVPQTELRQPDSI